SVEAFSPSSMVAWYPTNGNTNDVIGGNNGTLQNGATFALGVVGQALSLDGVDDYVSINPSASLDAFASATIDSWIKMDTVAGRHAIVSKVPIGSYYLLVNNGMLSF